jgi:hypothetical protein
MKESFPNKDFSLLLKIVQLVIAEFVIGELVKAELVKAEFVIPWKPHNVTLRPR